jgi:hypothetical protein
MRSPKDKQGFLLIAVVVCVASGLIIAAMARHPPAPGANNCIGTPAATTAIVIDRSDEVTQQTLAEIRKRAMAYVADSVSDNELVSVFTVDASSSTALVPLVSRCRPRRNGSRITENVKALEKNYRERFEVPIDSALRVRPVPSAVSPLAQALIDISLSQYLRAKKNTLLVFSDMLENTPQFSLYGCITPDDVVSRFRVTRTGAQERPEFRNTMVRLNVIPRLGQTRQEIVCRDRLWTWFFGDNPGTHAGVTLDYLPGGPSVNQVEAGSR